MHPQKPLGPPTTSYVQLPDLAVQPPVGLHLGKQQWKYGASEFCWPSAWICEALQQKPKLAQTQKLLTIDPLNLPGDHNNFVGSSSYSLGKAGAVRVATVLLVE